MESISISHHNLASSLSIAGSDQALAHRLAAGMIDYPTGSGLFASTLRMLSLDLVRFGAEALPASFDQLCQTVEEVEGVRFRELFEQLAGVGVDGNKVMLEVIEMAKEAKHEDEAG